MPLVKVQVKLIEGCLVAYSALHILFLGCGGHRMPTEGQRCQRNACQARGGRRLGLKPMKESLSPLVELTLQQCMTPAAATLQSVGNPGNPTGSKPPDACPGGQCLGARGRTRRGDMGGVAVDSLFAAQTAAESLAVSQPSARSVARKDQRHTAGRILPTKPVKLGRSVRFFTSHSRR